jgi:hypothetical protein
VELTHTYLRPAGLLVSMAHGTQAASPDLIGELSTRGDTFRQRWAQHEVRRPRAGAKRLNHPLVGQMTFTYETMELAADEGLYLIACGAAPGSRDADALNLLASWNATDNGGLVAPTIGAQTAGWRSTQASATWAMVTPRAWASVCTALTTGSSRGESKASPA